jgi:uncharacterized protein YecT (DUF1311 family)
MEWEDERSASVKMKPAPYASVAAMGLALLLTAPPPRLNAQQGTHTSASYAACLDKAAGGTPAMQECIMLEHERQDRRLNTSYEALIGSVTEERRAQLRDAQRKWIAFRDANCGFYFDPQGGSAARLASNECLVTLTADRAFELENLKTK